MAFIEQNVSFEQRMSKQLLSISDLTEKLTFRIIELEEKIDSLQNYQAQLNSSQDTIEHKALVDNEDKLLELNDLLQSKKSVTERKVEDDGLNQSLVEDKTDLSIVANEDNDPIESIETEYIDSPQEDILSA